MLWAKLMNRLFGWEYAIFSYFEYHVIGRIRVDMVGNEFCIYKGRLIVNDGKRDWRRVL